jgi:hypothetical protein
VRAPPGPSPAQDLSLSAARYGDHAAEPGLGPGHYLHPDGARLRLSRCRTGLGDPPGSVLAAVDHDGGGLLRRDPGGCLARHGKPEIFNTDQNSQFTGSAFTRLPASHGIAISMDGKGAWRDNVFVERLWKSIKYEEVYLHAYESFGEARHSIGRYLDLYNGRRPHSSLDDMTPDQAYFNLPSSARRPNPAEASLIDAKLLFDNRDQFSAIAATIKITHYPNLNNYGTINAFFSWAGGQPWKSRFGSLRLAQFLFW